MPDTSKRSFETPDILSDLPLEQPDQKAYFHFDEFAATLARLIADKKTRTPLTIGVSGAWGSGKTSLLHRVQRQLDQTKTLLDEDKPALIDFVNPKENPKQQFRVCRTVWFNAWKYADEDALLVALVRRIVQEMYRDDWVSKSAAAIFDPFKDRRDVIDTVLRWFKIKTPFLEITPNTGDPQPTPLAEKTALLDLFDEAFDRLIAAWVHHKLDLDRIDPSQGVMVVFIDDLDRCLPAKAVQVLEAIKLFLDKPGCVFVLGADAEVVRQAVESHYQNAKVTGQNAADYLEKVIQLRFDLPPVADTAMQSFLEEQQVNDEMRAEWRTLLAAADVNPRRVKGVLNDIDLQWRMLVNSGQAEGVQRGNFIRWSSLLRAAPVGFKERLFDIDDLDLRLKFIQDALRWGGGEADESLGRTFQDYAKASRLRRVLRQIGAFSEGFDAQTLDAFIHLAAPPAKATQKPEEAREIAGEAEIKLANVEVTGREKVTGPDEAHPNHRTWAGIEMVRIPAGKFLMGSKHDNSLAFDDEKPQHTIEIAQEYWIGRYTVTNPQFSEFIRSTEFRTTAEERGSAYARTGNEWKETQGADWQHPGGPKSNLQNKESHPVVAVSWPDARAFCDWLNQAYVSELPQGWAFRLPCEAEWEKAARGEYGNEWPWGNEEPNKDRCNFNMNVGDTTPAGQYSPQGDSPYGCADMAGNVWEWTSSQDKKYPYQIKDGRETVNDTSGRVLRGGSFGSLAQSVRCASRSGDYPYSRLTGHGFRVLLSPI
jgi:gamma-glutamyl hercynylcysteine S-oxide synthase